MRDIADDFPDVAEYERVYQLVRPGWFPDAAWALTSTHLARRCIEDIGDPAAEARIGARIAALLDAIRERK